MTSQNFLVVVITCYFFSLIWVGFSAAAEGGVESDQPLPCGRGDGEAASYFYYQQADYPRDCQDVYNQCANTTDGIYFIKPEGCSEPFEVFCNNSIDGGGWTVFQRRRYGDVNFDRNWDHYRIGFGSLHQDFWLGNDKLAFLTNQREYELRIDLVSSSLVSRYAHYNLFRISYEKTMYTLVGLGIYSGDSGNDSLRWNVGNQFSTYDKDNDASSSYHCAHSHQGGWWYVTNVEKNHCFGQPAGYYCSHSNLNGKFCDCGGRGIFWYGLSHRGCNINFTEMKIRPIKVD